MGLDKGHPVQGFYPLEIGFLKSLWLWFCARAGCPKMEFVSYGTKGYRKPEKCNVYPITIAKGKLNGVLGLFLKEDIEHRE
ncbi:hypothetical protein [Flagellimonas pacifica]|uniref:hypothetical protein n=1 Tax=Flagellimonas pacifica TaxID=1247520 RepID=UPI000BE38F52|nr:hypothetical protein [Allomuricauda parva]